MRLHIHKLNGKKAKQGMTATRKREHQHIIDTITSSTNVRFQSVKFARTKPDAKIKQRLLLLAPPLSVLLFLP